MITLEITNNIDSNIRSLEHCYDLKKILRVRKPGYQYSQAFKRRHWDGYINFLQNGSFLTGLMEYATEALSAEGHDVDIEDRRGDAPAYYPPVLHGRTRYPHQEAAAHAATSNTFLDLPWPRGIVKIGTGGGKTTIIADLAGGYAREEVLVLLHRKELLHQTAEDLQSVLHEQIGKVGDAHATIKRITVGTVQTLASRLDSFLPWLNRVGVLLIDEAHHLGAETHQTICDAVPAFVRVGFSATPFKDDDPVQTLFVQGFTGSKVLFDLGAAALAEAGIVTPVEVHYSRMTEPTMIIKKNGMPCSTEHLSWPDAYQYMIVENLVRNSTIAGRALASKEPTLIVVQRVQHGINIARLLNCPFMSGSEDTATRQQALRDLGSGAIPYLVATTIFDEGVDVPAISRLILAAGGKSDIQLLQRIGRGMRRAEGKTELQVFDFFDETNKHLRKHSMERIAAAKQAGFRTQLAA